MKRIMTETGWIETISKEFKFTGVFKKFQTAFHWVDFTTRTPSLNTKGRNHCERCGLRWKDAEIDLMTYFAMTDKGNKVLCEPCYDAVKHLDKTLEDVKS